MTAEQIADELQTLLEETGDIDAVLSQLEQYEAEGISPDVRDEAASILAERQRDSAAADFAHADALEVFGRKH